MAAQPKPAYLGVFANIEFPDYKYEHYPLMMTKPGEEGKPALERIVADAIEEERAASDGFTSPQRVGPPVVMTQPEVEKLRAEAAENAEIAIAAKAVALERDERVQKLEAELALLRGKPKPEAEAKPDVKSK